MWYDDSSNEDFMPIAIISTAEGGPLECLPTPHATKDTEYAESLMDEPKCPLQIPLPSATVRNLHDQILHPCAIFRVMKDALATNMMSTQAKQISIQQGKMLNINNNLTPDQENHTTKLLTR